MGVSIFLSVVFVFLVILFGFLLILWFFVLFVCECVVVKIVKIIFFGAKRYVSLCRRKQSWNSMDICATRIFAVFWLCLIIFLE